MRTHANEPLHADHALVVTAITAAKQAGNREAAIQAALERMPSDRKRREVILREVMSCIDHLYGV